MKPRATAILLVGLFALALGAASDEIPRGYYSQGNLGSLSQALPRSQPEGSLYAVDDYPLYRPQLAPGKGRQLVEAYCSTCHSTRYITMQPPLPAAVWEAEVKKMIHTFGQPIPEDAAPGIVHYLQTHYTPETRKR